MMRGLFTLSLLSALLLAPALGRAKEENPEVIEDGRTVSLEYTLSLDDGTTAGTNVGEEPLVYQQGGDQILPALESALAGMKAGDSKQVTLAPAQGYGEIDQGLFEEVETNLVPEEARTAGTTLVSEDPAGNRRMIRVHEVKGEMIVLDLNHPLAGQTLHFDVKVVGIE
jgi:FKBP-type peptidyl-prolyl cis-trans isomerase SlyD